MPKHSIPVGEVFQHTHTQAYTGSSLGLYGRMLDSLKILMNRATETMECFVGNVSAAVLPERIFLSEAYNSRQKLYMCVCVCTLHPALLFIDPCFICIKVHKAAVLSFFITSFSLSVLAVSFLLPSLRESSDISRVCPALHSCSGSEECLVLKLQQLGSLLCADYTCFSTFALGCFGAKNNFVYLLQ